MLESSTLEPADDASLSVGEFSSFESETMSSSSETGSSSSSSDDSSPSESRRLPLRPFFFRCCESDVVQHVRQHRRPRNPMWEANSLCMGLSPSMARTKGSSSTGSLVLASHAQTPSF